MFRLGFEPRVLQLTKDGEKKYGAVFAGGMSRAHRPGNGILEAVAQRTRVDFWGVGMSRRGGSRTIRKTFHGPLWGLEMFQLLRDARISLNRHIGCSGGFANNMRMFETTGVGPFLLTDWKANTSDLFEPGREVVEYTNAEDCAEKIGYYLEHEKEREQIASAGQRRTLAEHTYAHRMRELVEIAGEHL